MSVRHSMQLNEPSNSNYNIFNAPIKFGKKIVSFSCQTVVKVADAGAKIKSDTGATFRSFRFTRYALLPWESKSPSVSNLRSQLLIADKVINCFMFIGDIDYFVNRRFIKEGEPINKLHLIGSSIMAAVDLGSVCSWLNDLKILELGKIAAEMGKVPVLRTVALVSLGTYLSGGAVVALTFLLVDSTNKFDRAYNQDQRIKSAIDIASRIVAISLITFGLSGGTALVVLVPLGVLSATLGLSSFLYGEYHKPQLAEKQPQPGYEAPLSRQLFNKAAKPFFAQPRVQRSMVALANS